MERMNATCLTLLVYVTSSKSRGGNIIKEGICNAFSVVYLQVLFLIFYFFVMHL